MFRALAVATAGAAAAFVLTQKDKTPFANLLPAKISAKKEMAVRRARVALRARASAWVGACAGSHAGLLQRDGPARRLASAPDFAAAVRALECSLRGLSR